MLSVVNEFLKLEHRQRHRSGVGRLCQRQFPRSWCFVVLHFASFYRGNALITR